MFSLIRLVPIILMIVTFIWGFYKSYKFDRLLTDIDNYKVQVSKLKSDIELSESRSARLEMSISDLERSKAKVIEDRNKAWREMASYESGLQRYKNLTNLNKSEKKYVECQTVPVPSSRK